jgi:hypothetical protein
MVARRMKVKTSVEVETVSEVKTIAEGYPEPHYQYHACYIDGF